MVSFELSKDIEKYVFHLVASVGQRKNSLGPHEESNPRPSDSALRYSTIEPQRFCGERGLLRSSCVTPILDTARIRDVDSVMFLSRIRKMVGFKLSRETEKDVFRLVTSVDDGKGIFLHFLLKPTFCNKEYYFRYKYESSSLFGGASPISASTTFFSPSPVVS